MTAIVLLSFYTGILVCTILLRIYLSKRVSSPTTPPYPPGPKPVPLLGNFFDVPKTESWKTYAAWGRQYGEIVHFTVLGDHFYVLNSARVVTDLLEKRASKYSDKPASPMTKLLGWLWALSLMPYGERWRLYRREFHQQFRAEKNRDYLPIIARGANELVCNLLAAPQKFSSHMRNFAGRNIMSIVYDYDVAPQNDRFVDIAEKAMEMLNNSTFPGAALVNVLPFLQYLPAWLPGMGFKRYARRSEKLVTQMRNEPFEYVKERLSTGTPTKCVVANVLKRFSTPRAGAFEDPEDTVKNVSAMAYSGGSDTLVSAMDTSVLAMILYPDAKSKAQAELDRIIGHERLPTFDDRDSLPYVEAFVREVLRWHPVLPLSVAHTVTDDDIYDGYFIPKGSIIMTNIWALQQDETVYGDEPEKFKPERFLKSDGTISGLYPLTAFGAGRRICAGRHTADSTLWIQTVLTLAAFNVTNAKDEVGSEIHVSDRYTNTLVSHSLPFTCNITPRSRQAEMLVRELGEYV
ncbi:cytochrome P450 [Neolentinus lepideus HHB14362 ss-1]|uniref:Cytochrome P450 n=1 Tax=Neolentinus lepideus HHB14362 ss-1 TaxID=1314782 RepID=A0A165QPL6_9AGAM|nr:cytochrome P450 [Neolentinus lepideus HHB14362 ss-1]